MASNLRDIYVGVKQNDANRRTNDLYPTPPLATHILRKYSPVPKHVVEPCAGRGHISVELERKGHTVYSYDLYDYPNKFTNITTGQDALSLDPPLIEPAIGLVTNPPYHKNLPSKLLQKWLTEYDYIAMFLRLTFLEGMKRYEIFTKRPPTDIIFLSDRVKFKEMDEEPKSADDQIGGMIAYAWFIWDNRPNQLNTNLKWVLLKNEYEEWYTETYGEQPE